MPPVTHLFFAAVSASCFTIAAAASLDLPIIVDNGYKTVEFAIGTPSKTYRLLFDTGSASSWAVDGTCTDTCPNGSGYDRVGYNINGSTTGHYTGGYADIPYLGGRTAGPAVSEVWKTDGRVWNQTFIAANESNWAALAADGFMGLAFSSIIDGGANTVVETLMAEGHLDAAKFGIYYGTEFNDTKGQPGDGVLTIGASKESEYVEGELVTIPITRVDGGYDVWRSTILAVNGTKRVNGIEIQTKTDFDIGNVVFDTGAGSITLPDEENLKVYESIGMNYTAILNGEHIPLCSEFNSSWSLSFSFGDYRDPQVVTLRGDQLRRPGFAYRDDACWPPFDGGASPGFTLIGTPFLRNFYTVWDYGVSPTETDISKFDPQLSFGELKLKTN
ncbi:aspartic peptidase domain-containing protein [Ilyonectria robusta]|uniref:aspartic peptidase domain-containing protein n=1 Tax=Ilyonectria robusta TaxID=1079257 RepID=UPI001E8E6767|nr:aspartic peptidase domain-containing protein [Ilyonectria robusta]KAH8677257.1 aspartic peptidase domain-containing protein [Ilyonectria robusta]